MSTELHTWTSEIVQHKCPASLLKCFVCPTTFKVLLNSTSDCNWSSKQNVLLKLESFQPFYYSCPSEDAGVWFCFCHWANCWDTSGPHTWTRTQSVILCWNKATGAQTSGEVSLPSCVSAVFVQHLSMCMCITHSHWQRGCVYVSVFSMNCSCFAH